MTGRTTCLAITATFSTSKELAFLDKEYSMEYRDRITKVLKKEFGKDSSYIKYVLRSDTGEGELHVEGETIRVPAYSFTEMSDIVRCEFEKANPVRMTVPIGFRGERFVSDAKELEIYATGSAGLIEYRLNTRTREAEHG